MEKSDLKKLPYLWNLLYTGWSFHKPAGGSLYLSRKLHKDWQFVQSRWVKYPPFKFLAKTVAIYWFLWSGEIEKIANLTGVKDLTNSTSVSNPHKEMKMVSKLHYLSGREGFPPWKVILNGKEALRKNFSWEVNGMRRPQGGIELRQLKGSHLNIAKGTTNPMLSAPDKVTTETRYKQATTSYQLSPTYR